MICPAISNTELSIPWNPAMIQSLLQLHTLILCDACLEPPDDDDDDDDYPGVHTLMNADKQDDLRDTAEIALKFYNETKLKNFKLVKVCKINVGFPFFWPTFRAHEVGNEDVLFRGGVVYSYGKRRKKAVFCEIKDDDEVTLLPGDGDDVQSKGSFDSEDSDRLMCYDIELSDREHTVLGRIAIKAFNDLPSYIEYRVIKPMEPCDDSKSPAIAYSHRRSLSSLRKLCDVCSESPGDEEYCWVYTLNNVDKRYDLRYMAETSLKFYNETNMKNFKLVKVCKVNVGRPYFCLTFTAQQDGSEEHVLFRGVVLVFTLSEELLVFCEIKDDDEVTLLPVDDDDVQLEGSCDSKDGSPFTCDDKVIKAFNELLSDTESSDTKYSVIELTPVMIQSLLQAQTLIVVRCHLSAKYEIRYLIVHVIVSFCII